MSEHDKTIFREGENYAWTQIISCLRERLEKRTSPDKINELESLLYWCERQKQVVAAQ